jgi:adenylate cyclase
MRAEVLHQRQAAPEMSGGADTPLAEKLHALRRALASIVPSSEGGQVMGFVLLPLTTDAHCSAPGADDFLAHAKVLLGQALDKDRPHASNDRADDSQDAALTLRVRRNPVDCSIFINGNYLIRGVAGAILWRTLGDYQRTRRTEFSYRELRLDSSLRLPDFADNLASRLILLQHRLEQQCPGIEIHKRARGRFELRVHHALELLE